MKTIRFLLILFAAVRIGDAFSSGVEFIQRPDRVDVFINGRAVTTWMHGRELAKPVLFPLRTLSGVAVTRGFPMEQAEGESIDHPHHTGVFFTFDGVNGLKRDRFWTATVPPPQIKQVKINKMKSGKDNGTLLVILHWIGDSGKTILEEKRTMIFYPKQDGYAIDFTMMLTAKDSAVVFEDTKEGMFAIRVTDRLSEKSGTGRYLNSRGNETEQGVWGRRAEWVRLEGAMDGTAVGIAIFNHPTSVNYPTYWQARGYGLFSADPCGQLDFQKALKVENPKPFNLILQKNKSALFKFLMLVYEGPRTKTQLDSVFAEYGRK